MEFTDHELKMAVDAAVLASMMATAMVGAPVPINDEGISNPDSFRLIKLAVVDSSESVVNTAVSRVFTVLKMIASEYGVPVDFVVRSGTYSACNRSTTGRASTRMSAALMYVYMRLLDQGIAPRFGDVCRVLSKHGAGILYRASTGHYSPNRLKEVVDRAVTELLSSYR